MAQILNSPFFSLVKVNHIRVQLIILVCNAEQWFTSCTGVLYFVEKGLKAKHVAFIAFSL